MDRAHFLNQSWQSSATLYILKLNIINHEINERARKFIHVSSANRTEQQVKKATTQVKEYTEKQETRKNISSYCAEIFGSCYRNAPCAKRNRKHDMVPNSLLLDHE